MLKIMANPLVSICCITYNHASFIRQCIDGFLMQKPPSSVPQGAMLSDWCEILIHDDCSTDGTIDIINEYAQKFPDLIFPLFEKENQYSRGWAGKMSLFNYKRARGKYIAYCEGDDYWTESFKLQKQVDFLDANIDYSVCFHRCKHFIVSSGIYEDDDCGFLFPNNETGVDISMDLFFKHWVTQPLTMVCRASMHDISVAYKYRYYRDMHEIYYLLKAGKCYLFNFVGGVYVCHIGGISSQISKKEYCETSLPIDSEFYRYNRCEPGAKFTYLSTLQLCVNEFAHENKLKALKYAIQHVCVSRFYKTFLRNLKLIVTS